MNLKLVGAAAGLLALAIELLGCGLPSVKPKAAQSLGCPEKQIQVEDTDSLAVKTVNGCGKTDLMSYDNSKWGSLRELAAYEMNCPSSELTVQAVMSNSYGVKGCNKRAVYKLVPYIGLTLDSIQADGDAAPAKPAAPASDAPAAAAGAPTPAS
jgi:hypothetical protein